MEGDTLIIDILFAVATCLFVVADCKQVHKMWKFRVVDGISFTHYKLKMIAVFLMFIGYTLSELHLSILVSGANVILTILALVFVIKYRRN